MDPLSLSSSIIGILTVAGKLLSAGYAYGNSVKDFPDELQGLVGELSSLCGILHALRAVMDSADDGDSTAAGPGPSKIARAMAIPLENCGKLLSEMLADLEKYQKPGSRMQKVVKRLTWPLKEGETKSWVETIGRYKSTFALALSADELTLTRMISKDIGEMKRLQIMEVDRKETALKKELVSTVLHWVSSADAEENHLAARKLQQAGTGRWFTSSVVFEDWLTKDYSFLWMYGIPGAGKTILSSIIIDRILSEVATRNMTNTAVVYFYFDFKETSKQSTAGFLGSMIAQLVQQNAETFRFVDIFYNTCDTGRKPPDPLGLERCLVSIIGRFAKVIIVIDALDECTEQADLFNIIKRLNGLSNTNLLLTSRDELDIRLHLANLPCLQIKGDDVSIDIENFVNGEIQRQPKLARLKPATKCEITEALVSGANGMFRWVRCCIDHITKLRNDKAIKVALKSLPPTLEKTYERILCDIPDEDKDLAIRVLQWLLFSRRPMHLTEIADGIAVEAGEKSMDPDNRLNDITDIKDICGGLVELDDVSLILGLAHFTVKEYLISTGITNGPAAGFHVQCSVANAELAKICLTYVMFESFETGPCNDYKTRIEEYPLFAYAGQYWSDHASECILGTDHTLDSLILEFFRLGQDSERYKTWRHVYEVSTDYWTITFSAERLNKYVTMWPAGCATPLYFAALLGQSHAVSDLLERGADINSKGGEFKTPLRAAVKGGHKETIRILLQNGADPNVEKDELSIAARNGRADCVQTLLDFGINTGHEKGGTWENPIYAAGWFGHGNVMEVLIEADYFKACGVKEIHEFSEHPFTLAIIWSAMQGFENPFRTLFKQYSVLGREPLSLLSREFIEQTTRRGHLSIIKAILENDDVKSRCIEDDNFRKTLQQAAYFGHEKLVEFLLGLRKTPGSGAIGAALHLAAVNGNVDIIERLIRAGADPSAKDEEGWSPVLCASEYHNHRAVDKLSTVVDIVELSDMMEKVGPTTWRKPDKSSGVEFSDDGLTIKNVENKAQIIRAQHPVAPLCDGYSFEVEIIEANSRIYIGFVDIFRQLVDGDEARPGLPGMRNMSWGYNNMGDVGLNDDGVHAPSFGAGDFVGCHFDKIQRVAFFTLNGDLVGKPFPDVKGKLLPLIAMGEGTHTRTNFGDCPFTYEVPKLSAEIMNDVWKPSYITTGMSPIWRKPDV